MIKPVLRYLGAKWILSKWICEHLPPHEVYVEPFFGSGAVFFRKESVYTETINKPPLRNSKSQNAHHSKGEAHQRLA